ncbi:MAG TPA: hypothetical protein VJ597_02360 [Sphingomicrobium sp.]|nr:hypothetical protein [Sphingomicrobium sp.]
MFTEVSTVAAMAFDPTAVAGPNTALESTPIAVAWSPKTEIALPHLSVLIPIGGGWTAPLMSQASCASAEFRCAMPIVITEAASKILVRTMTVLPVEYPPPPRVEQLEKYQK